MISVHSSATRNSSAAQETMGGSEKRDGRDSQQEDKPSSRRIVDAIFGAVSASATTATTAATTSSSKTNSKSQPGKDGDGPTSSSSSSSRKTSVVPGFLSPIVPTSELKPKEAQMRLGYIHALGMLFVLSVFLAAIYTSQEPYRYMASNLALNHDLYIPELSETETLNEHEIWDWMDKVISKTGGHTVEMIEANCAYSKYKKQSVIIDGVEYTMLDPTLRTSACPEESMQHINGRERATYLAGSHQLLSFGVFTKRSVPQEPIRGSVKASSELHRVPSNDIVSISPNLDRKVVDVCHVNVKPAGGEFNDTVCVLVDGFKGSVGSSLGWSGHKIHAHWDGQEYFAFDNASTATFYRKHRFQTAYPCYSYTAYSSSSGDQGLELAPGIPYYTGDVEDMEVYDCAHAWITAGEDIRATCLAELDKEPSARQAYVTAAEHHVDRIEFLEYHFGCGLATNLSHEELKGIFIEAEAPLAAHLDFDDSNGMFFHAENQQTWIESSLVGKELLQLNEFINSNTRVLEVFIVTRDLAAESLFYTMLQIQFLLNADGSVSFHYDSSFSPIMQYTYAMDGYEWHFREVMICEILFSVLFGYFVYREVSQLIFSRLVPGIKMLSHPARTEEPEQSHTPQVCIDTNDKNSECNNTLSISEATRSSTMHVEEFVHTDLNHSRGSGNDGKINGSSVRHHLPYHRSQEQPHTAEHHPGADGYLQSPNKKKRRKRLSWFHSADDGDDDVDEAELAEKQRERKERAQRSLVVRMKSLGTSRSFKGIDMNNNGIDDMEEIKEIIEDYLLPDAKGMADILDWATIATVSAAVYYRAHYVLLALSIHDLFLSLERGSNYNDFMESIVDDFKELDDIVGNTRFMALFIVIMGLLQFFRYLSFDRRFAIVTDTIMSSFVDLIPVLMIFSVVCVSYAVMGTAIYGQDLEAFGDMGSSLSSLFLMILGQFDGYYDMIGVAKAITALYFWSFVVIAYFILFNMVLAVIFTVYDEEYDDLKKNTKKGNDTSMRI